MFSVDFGLDHVFNRYTEHSITLGKKDYVEPGVEKALWNVMMGDDDKNMI